MHVGREVERNKAHFAISPDIALKGATPGPRKNRWVAKVLSTHTCHHWDWRVSGALVPACAPVKSNYSCECPAHRILLHAQPDSVFTHRRRKVLWQLGRERRGSPLHVQLPTAGMCAHQNKRNQSQVITLDVCGGLALWESHCAPAW